MLEIILAAAVVVAINVYVLLGGADYGGGVWDMFAFGPRAKPQRDLIAKAIAPVWEANHVWLIVVIVILFSCFPAAFSLISITLHIPLLCLLLGIVFRGAAFIFRAYDSQHSDTQRRWSVLFAITSMIAPVMLGICLGSVASGRLSLIQGLPSVGYFQWFAPFPIAVGIFTLVLFAYLAALYLAVEAPDDALKSDFRQRAILSALALGALAIIVFRLSSSGAPRLFARLGSSSWALPLHLAAAFAALGALGALVARRYVIARMLGVAQATLTVWGWAFAQYPYMIDPQLTISVAAAPKATLRLVLLALATGGAILFPSLYYLFSVFKGKKAFAIVDES